MPLPTQLVVRYRVITPTFLGGAEIADAELRPPSLKGALRFWYRAVDPEALTRTGDKKGKVGKGPVRESLLFGATEQGAGQSKVLLSLDKPQVGYFPATDIKWDQFAVGNGRRVKNGLSYLGYPLRPRRDDHPDDVRKALMPGSRFGVRLLVRPFVPRHDDDDAASTAAHRLTEREARGLVAATWLLGHVGGLGARSRRGFGTLAIDGWEAKGPDKAMFEAAMGALPLGSRLAGREAWEDAWSRARATFEQWFGGWPESAGDAPPHPHLGRRTRVSVLGEHLPLDAWPGALNRAGRILQDFRALRQPDYDMVKAHLLQLAKEPGGARLRAAPPRVAFGLPLTFRFGSIPNQRHGVTFVPYPKELEGATEPYAERMGSLLFIRLLALGDGLHSAFFRLDGALPGVGDHLVGERFRGGKALAPPASNALDEFMSTLEHP